MTETIQDIMYDGKYNYYGLRVVGDALAVGQVAPNSREWDDGELTGEELNGASAIALQTDDERIIDRATNRLVQYRGVQVVLLGAQHSEEGNDPDELVMEDAVVLAAWRR